MRAPPRSAPPKPTATASLATLPQSSSVPQMPSKTLRTKGRPRRYQSKDCLLYTSPSPRD
eukprot:14523353-Alexandrium_andersonii.AAC.1